MHLRASVCKKISLSLQVALHVMFHNEAKCTQLFPLKIVLVQRKTTKISTKFNHASKHYHTSPYWLLTSWQYCSFTETNGLKQTWPCVRKQSIHVHRLSTPFKNYSFSKHTSLLIILTMFETLECFRGLPHEPGFQLGCAQLLWLVWRPIQCFKLDPGSVWRDLDSISYGPSQFGYLDPDSHFDMHSLKHLCPIECSFLCIQQHLFSHCLSSIGSSFVNPLENIQFYTWRTVPKKNHFKKKNELWGWAKYYFERQYSRQWFARQQIRKRAENTF